ncbi:GGDEF domain-containing protein [Gemmatimonas sp. UBA7669]|uniref:GGDEF domain-containing protein n=1 Tax=Gemmatimonas sp. UBA7669 TaxID=1946568 RepID=UPI0025C4CE78|nr:sensor domain-containing diguanylate cyclase [Gemmatimonas sp. UBA7669]
MLDRIALRSTFWGALTLSILFVFALSQGVVQLPALSLLVPLLSAAALCCAIIGWRLLHHELLRRMQDDTELRRRMQRLEDAMQHSVDGVMLLRAVRNRDGSVHDLEITEVNATAATLFRSATTELTGRRLRRDLPSPLGETLFARYAAVLTLGSPIVEEVRADRRQFAAGWLMHQVTPTSEGVAVTVRDITRRKREEVRLRRASLTDDLTRLYNRRGFLALAEQQLRVARRQGKDAVVMYADMDGFKQLNDTYGHAVGDRALQAVSRLLQSTVRDCDVVARLGGDEFTILALAADGVGARIIQKRIEERLALLNASGAFPATIALTIGHTRVRPGDTASVPELLARADQLLYARKRRRQLTAMSAAIANANANTNTNTNTSADSQAGRSGGARKRMRTALPTAVPAEVAAVANAMATARGLIPAGTAAAAPTTSGVPSSLTAPSKSVSLPLPPTHAA